MNLSVLQVQGHRPVRGSDRPTIKAGGLHLEVSDLQEFVEAIEIDDGSPASRLQKTFWFLPNQKDSAKKVLLWKPGSPGWICSIAFFENRSDTSLCSIFEREGSEGGGNERG